MATSAQVAARAGVSRSTVSQVLNGHAHLFTDDTVARVRSAAHDLGYRPSMAGRSLRRGRSDIVITLVPDVTFSARVRELVDAITDGLAEAGLTNLLQVAGRGELSHEAVVDLRPFGLVSLAPLPGPQRARLQADGVRIVEQSARRQDAIDRAIGRLQARHLAGAGYRTIVVVAPADNRDGAYAPPRAAGVREWCAGQGLAWPPILRLSLDHTEAARVVRDLPAGPVGVAASNDEVALAVLGAALAQGRPVPDAIGIVGVDNSPIARAFTPPLTTIDYDMQFSGHEIVKALLEDAAPIVGARGEREVERRLAVIEGGTVRRAAVDGSIHGSGV